MVDEGFLVSGHVLCLGDHLPEHRASTTFPLRGAQEHSSSCGSESSHLGDLPTIPRYAQGFLIAITGFGMEVGVGGATGI